MLSPNVFHPTKPSAVGSRNSLAQQNRNQQTEVKQVVQDEVNAVLKGIEAKLPPEVLQQLDVMGGIKEKLYTYFNQNYQNMFNRYITTTEDEMLKKVRGLVDREEERILAKYTPQEIAQLLDKIGGPDKFNTGEIEKSVINMYGHLQGHIQRGVYDLETETNSLLRQKVDTGAFIRGENAYAVVKCAFKDSVAKPRTITDVKLSVNILDSELISPIFQYQATVEYLIKDQIASTIIDMIEREVERYQVDLVDEGKEELRDKDILFEKVKRIPLHTDDDKENESSVRYRLIAKNLMDKIEGLRAEIDPREFDPLNIRENIKRFVDLENIRNRGFNTAINSITAILDTSKLGYQYLENLKNARELVLREYEETDPSQLPDERYQLRLKYYDQAQIMKEQEAYDRQCRAYKDEIQYAYDVATALYENNKPLGGVTDFNDLARKMKRKVARIRENRGDQLYEEIDKVWNELMNIKAEETEVERLNRTYIYEKTLLQKMLLRIKEISEQTYGFRTPRERVLLEQRVAFLQRDFERFNYQINPYHIQPGLLLDVDVVSIKRKRFMLNRMANVLNEFLYGVSKGFQDAAFATFKRRRSTVRSDLEQEFATDASASSASSVDYSADSNMQSASLSDVAANPSNNISGSINVTPGDSDELLEL